MLNYPPWLLPFPQSFRLKASPFIRSPIIDGETSCIRVSVGLDSLQFAVVTAPCGWCNRWWQKRAIAYVRGFGGKTTIHWISSELRCYYCCLGLGRERFLPLARYTHRSLLPSPSIPCVFYRPSLPTMIPAGFSTITTYSRLGLPSLWMSEWYRTIRLLHSRNELKKITEPRLPNSAPCRKKKGGGEEEEQGRGTDFWLGWPTQWQPRFCWRSRREPRLACARLGLANLLVRSALNSERGRRQFALVYPRAPKPLPNPGYKYFEVCLILATINRDTPIITSTETVISFTGKYILI